MKFSYETITDRMRVVFLGSERCNAQRGATGIVNKKKSNNESIHIIWDQDEYSYDPNHKIKIRQQDGRYYYKNFVSCNSEEGKMILYKIGKTLDLADTPEQILITTNTSLFCSCNNPNIVENWTLNTKFLFCTNCRKEKRQ